MKRPRLTENAKKIRNEWTLERMQSQISHEAMRIIPSLYYHWQCVIGNKF